MTVIYRSNLSALWLTLQASEQLGILSGDYVQDYYGNAGQVSLYNAAENNFYPVVMIEAVEQTPEIPHDVFIGQVALASLPDGVYQVRGRVRDVAGNYTIIGDVQTPFGGERIVVLTFTLAAGDGKQRSYQAQGARISLGFGALAVLMPPGGAAGMLSKRVVAGPLVNSIKRGFL